MTNNIRALGMKTGPDPQAGLFPKAIFEEAIIPDDDIDYKFLFSPVENQGQVGTCVAFGVGSVFEAFMWKRRNVRTSVSKKAIYSLAKHAENPPDLTDDGLYVSQGLQVLEKGYVLSTDFAYSDNPATLFDEPNPKWIKTDFELLSFASVDVTAKNILTALYKNGPLAIGVNFPNSWMSAHERILPTDRLDDSAGGHCMAIVGAVAQGHGKFNVVIRNSWGESWAERGYGQADIDDLIRYNVLTDAYTVKV